MSQDTVVPCSCGKVALQTTGAPIMSVECLCESCRTAGKFFESLDSAPPLLEPNASTRCEMFRKDRVQCIRGAELLREHRLTTKSPTRRVVATCCNTAMFMEFKGGHWLSMYGRRWPAGTLPPLQMRTMARDALPEAAPMLSDGIPTSKSQSAAFMFKLLGAWVAMGFRVPKVDYVQGTLEASA